MRQKYGTKLEREREGINRLRETDRQADGKRGKERITNLLESECTNNEFFLHICIDEWALTCLLQICLIAIQIC